MAKIIKVIFTEDGEVHYDVEGFNGDGCKKATRSLERAIGGKLVSRKMKRESRSAPGPVRTIGA